MIVKHVLLFLSILQYFSSVISLQCYVGQNDLISEAECDEDYCASIMGDILGVAQGVIESQKIFVVHSDNCQILYLDVVHFLISIMPMPAHH